VKTDATGLYQFGKTQILENTSYDLTVEKKGYYGAKGRETTVGLKKSTDLVHDFNLVPIPREPIVLPDVLYVIAQWYLTPQAKDSLNWLVNILRDNPRWVIELSSHTDSRPIPMTNDSLSQRRAKSAVDYIVDSNGINAFRIKPKGYGANRPRILDRDKNIMLDEKKYPQCRGQRFFFAKGTQMTDEFIKSLKTTCEKEAAHQLNRRTEFQVLSEDFVPPMTNDSSAQSLVIEVNPMDNVVTILPLGGGAFEGRCVINGISSDFKYEATSDTMQISTDFALRLLKEYRITVSDFKAKDKSFNEDGSIKENSMVNLKKINIGKKTQANLNAVIVKGLNPDVLIGSKVLSKFGDFTIDEDKKQLLFDVPVVPDGENK
jgi:outer membrane protein OmpA-like peptidoglycan-associated protein